MTIIVHRLDQIRSTRLVALALVLFVAVESRAGAGRSGRSHAYITMWPWRVATDSCGEWRRAVPSECSGGASGDEGGHLSDTCHDPEKVGHRGSNPGVK